MMTPRKPKLKQTSERDDWDYESESASDARRQPARASDPAGLRRTSKHRAPKQPVKPPQKKARSEGSAKAREKESASRKQASLVERISPDIFTRRLIRSIWVIFLSVAAVSILLFIYFFFDGWRFFALRDVQVEGNVLLKRESVKGIAERYAKDGVWRANLKKIREEVYSTGYVKSVEVTRVLPDMIKVVVAERDPIALARLGSSVVCVDREGVMFGDQSLLKAKGVTPLLNDLEESRDQPSKYNQERLAVYQKLMTDLDSSSEKLSSRIQEVFFKKWPEVYVTIEAPDKEGVITVYLGKEEFRIRLNAALDVLDAINRQDLAALNVFRISDAEKLIGARISYLNATSPNRVVVGLEE